MVVKIRNWLTEDAEKLSKIINNEKVQNNLRDGIPFPYTISDAKDFIQLMLESDKNNVFPWAITVDNSLVGSIGVFRKDNIHRYTAEMGYYISEHYWGKGITSDAVKLACEYIFNNTDIIRIFAEPFSFNTASCRVLEKCGFKFEGTLRKNAVKNGQVLDMRMYSIIKKD